MRATADPRRRADREPRQLPGPRHRAAAQLDRARTKRRRATGHPRPFGPGDCRPKLCTARWQADRRWLRAHRATVAAASRCTRAAPEHRQVVVLPATERPPLRSRALMGPYALAYLYRNRL